jgi:hypothetical protein
MSVLLMACSSSKDLDKDTAEWRYEVEPVNTGVQGTYQIKVWTYAKKPEEALQQSKKNAVHAVLYKGFSSQGRIKGQKPLLRSAEEMKAFETKEKDFFLDGGNYARFISLADHGAVEAGDRIKIGKEYKIGVIASVSVSELRKYLEEQEVIRSLDDGF